MELLTSLATHNAPDLPQLTRFTLLSLLRSIKHILLLYPLNLLIFTLAIALLTHKIISPFKKKQKFRATYDPLPHRDSNIEDIKSLKKQVREVQTGLIAILKKANHPSNSRQPQQKKASQVGLMQQQGSMNEQMSSLLSKMSDKSMELQQAQSQLKVVVGNAYQQIAKLNAA